MALFCLARCAKRRTVGAAAAELHQAAKDGETAKLKPLLAEIVDGCWPQEIVDSRRGEVRLLPAAAPPPAAGPRRRLRRGPAKHVATKRTRKQVWLKATKPINPGAEIFVTYGRDYWKRQDEDDVGVEV